MRHIAPQDPRLPGLFKEYVQRYQPPPERLQLFRHIHNVLNRVSDRDTPGTRVEVGPW